MNNEKNKKIYTSTLLIFSIIGIISGCGFFFWANGWVIFLFPQFGTSKKNQTSLQEEKKSNKQEYLLYMPRKKNHIERESILITDCNAQVAQTSIANWLAKIYEEGLLEKQTSLQDVSLNADGQDLIVSFDRPPFNKQASIYEKLFFLNSLCKTLIPLLPNVRTITWLVHHAPLNDCHLDTTQPWPIEGFIDKKKIQQPQLKKVFNKKNLTIMLDPAGDAANKGRLIDGTFERGITLQCAEYIKKTLQKDTSYRSILTRFPGETIEPLQNAMFSNRLQADIFINVNFFWKSTEPAECFLLYYINNPSSTIWSQQTPFWVPITDAYKKNLKATILVGSTLENNIRKEFNKTIALNPLLGAPIKPLMGLTCPAISIEIGLTKTTNLAKIMPALSTAIKNSLAELSKDDTTDT